MEFVDTELTCIDCTNPFTFEAGEQRYFRERGLANKPKRCKPCRAQRNKIFDAQRAEQRKQQPLVSIVCAQCGKDDQVSFKPTQGRPVLCKECFEESQIS